MDVDENSDQWKLGRHMSSGFSFVGVVADVSRADEAEYNSKTCCVFGLTEQEWLSIKSMKDDAIKPTTFYETAPRFKMNEEDKGFGFLGVAADLIRLDGCDFQAPECCVFGINEDEFNSICELEGHGVKPRQYLGPNVRYRVMRPPWYVLRVLGEKHGYVGKAKPSFKPVAVAQGKDTLLWSLYKK